MDNSDILSFEPNKKYLYQGRLYRIQSAISLDTVLLREVKTGKSCTAKINELTSPDAPTTDLKYAQLPRVELTLVSSDDWRRLKSVKPSSNPCHSLIVLEYRPKLPVSI
jgi:hypothetical protein